METSIIISGFGGQGTLFAGQVLTYAEPVASTFIVSAWLRSRNVKRGSAQCRCFSPYRICFSVNALLVRTHEVSLDRFSLVWSQKGFLPSSVRPIVIAS